MMDTRVMLVLGMVEAHDAVFPSAYPEASPAVDQQRRGGVALAQSGIAHHPAAFLVEAEQAALPGSDIQVALGVLGQRVHADRHVDLAKLILAGIITGNAGVCAHPDCSVGRCEKHIDRTGLITMQMVGLKPPLLPVMAHQSVACSYPKAIFLVFCHTAHIIVGQDSRRIGIAPVWLEMIAVERMESLVRSYPHQSVVVEHQAAGVLSSRNRCLRQDSEGHMLRCYHLTDSQ